MAGRGGAAFDEAVRRVMAEGLSHDDAAAAIQELTTARSAAFQSAARAQGVGARERERQAGGLASGGSRHPVACQHYARKCLIKAACCNKYYACHRCHDDAVAGTGAGPGGADHKINRFATALVACAECGAEELPVAPNCARCGVCFARYYCAHCKMFEDDAEKAANMYHCERCGLCRRGKGLGIDNHHCDSCGCCVPLQFKESHPCVSGSLQAECPVCREDMASSTEQVMFMRCGHAMHANCFSLYTARKYTCPVCCKSLTDMSRWFRALDERIAGETMPEGCAQRRVRVLCNDCQAKTEVAWHHTFHKCGVGTCGSYNTRRI
jgi:RING finger and CHY zinc finger domain-containing protein 1